MGIQWADFPSGSHGLYGTSNEGDLLDGLYANLWSAGASPNTTALSDDPDSGIGSAGIVARCDGSTGSSGNASEGFRRVLTTEQATAGFAFRIWLAKLPSENTRAPFVSFRDNSNVDILTLRVTTTGGLQLASGTGTGNGEGTGLDGTTLATTAGPAVTANAWTHIEFKCTKGNGTGASEVRVEGIEQTNLTLTSQSLSANNIAQIAYGVMDDGGGNDGAMVAYFKDTALWDTTGSEANDFIGSQQVFWLPLDGDSTLGGWTTSTGATGFDLLNEAPADDTDYIAADDTPPAAAEFTLEDLPSDVTSVLAILPIARMMKTDGGDCTIQMAVSPNATDYDSGADRPITTAFTYWWDVSHLSPATAAAWTPAEVDATTLRIDRTL